MRVAVDCKSPLLQKSLELFLGEHLSSTKHGDIVIKDKRCLNDKRCFYVASAKDADLKKPFSKSQLILALEERYKNLYKMDFYHSKKIDLEELERKIGALTLEYQTNILKTIREFYEE